MIEQEKNKVGRPNEYRPEYVEKVDQYLKENQDILEIRDNKKKLRVNLPTIEGFALFLGVSKSSIYNWKAEYAEFLDSLEKLIAEQKQRLINCGLSGDYNPTICKLILASNHGMTDRQEINDTKTYVEMGRVIIDGKEIEYDIGEKVEK